MSCQCHVETSSLMLMVDSTNCILNRLACLFSYLQDKVLIAAVQEYNGKSWKKIGKLIFSFLFSDFRSTLLLPLCILNDWSQVKIFVPRFILSLALSI